MRIGDSSCGEGEHRITKIVGHPGSKEAMNNQTENKRKLLQRKSRIIESSDGGILGGTGAEGLPRHDFAYRALGDVPVISVYTAGPDEWGEQCYRYRENSNTFALELVIDGEFLFADNGNWYPAPPGSLFIVHLHHDIEMMCASRCAHKRTIILCGQLLEAIISSLHLDKCVFMPSVPLTEAEDRFKQTEQLLLRGDSNSLRQADAGALELLLWLSETIHQPLSEKIQNALQWIDNHLGTTMSVEELARHLHVGVATVYRLFRENCHCSPQAYFVSKKMMAAEWMLRNSEYSIKEIAGRLGYESQLYFSTVFRKYHKVSPRTFRFGKQSVRRENELQELD